MNYVHGSKNKVRNADLAESAIEAISHRHPAPIRPYSSIEKIILHKSATNLRQNPCVDASRTLKPNNFQAVTQAVTQAVNPRSGAGHQAVNPRSKSEQLPDTIRPLSGQNATAELTNIA